VQNGSILVTRSGAGSIGRAGIYLGSDRPFTNEHIVQVHVSPPHDAAYVAVFLSSWWGERALEQGITGSTGQLQLNQSRIGSVPIRTPSPAIQRAIGNKVRKAERLRELATESRAWANKKIDNLYGSLPTEGSYPQHGWLSNADVDALRIDAWYYRPFYMTVADRLRNLDGLRPVASICELPKIPVDWAKWKEESFDYFEIGGIASDTGEATAASVLSADAPSRAKYLVQAGDVLVSTVRPNLRAVGQIDPDRPHTGVATSGFCILRSDLPEVGAYVRACLVHDAGMHQLMRWNTGATYPAIDREVPGRVLIPFEQETAAEIGSRLLQSLRNIREATRMIASARIAVESLIDGTLDEPALLAEGEAIERWLADNPSPNQTEKP
jgi:type I restriction enzyme S subunit